MLENKQYTRCTINFKTTVLSYKINKRIYNDESDWQVIPNTQEAIIDEDTFNRVQELRKSRRRNTATGRTSLFFQDLHIVPIVVQSFTFVLLKV